MYTRQLLLGLLCGVLIGAPASADVVTIGTVKDNTLYENVAGTVSNGAGQYFFTGRNAFIGGMLIRRAVIAFDIAGNIPAGSTINSVQLTLSMSRTRLVTARITSLHRALADWGEGTSDAFGQEGQGTTATTGDATWIHTFFNTNFWVAAGGDFAPVPSASLSVGGGVCSIGGAPCAVFCPVGQGVCLEQAYTWASTPALVADVQMWLDNPVANFGWVIRGDESTGSTAKRFNSRENPVPASRPSLVVDFTAPVLIGACCDELTGVCTPDVELSVCTAGGGRFDGDGSVCDVIPCDPSGACCDDATGNCTDLVTQNECEIVLGFRYGGDTFRAGGWLGRLLASGLLAVLNTPGAFALSITLVVASIILTTRFSFWRMLEVLYRWASGTTGALASGFRGFLERRRKEAKKRAIIRKHSNRSVQRSKPLPSFERRPSIPLDAESAVPASPGPRGSTSPKIVKEAGKKKAGAPRESPKQQDLPLLRAQTGYSLPPLELLNEPEPQATEGEKELLERARQLTKKFREFSLDGSVVAIHPGPVVTTFEFKPEAGVKYSKITSLIDDLCLALKAESARIDRMPGRSTVGIEVPNRRQETIFPRELLGSESFRSSKSKLTLALGKNINGEVFTADLRSMPHLLIAGATGAGKSVGINGMIASILYKSTPADVRFIMIDTKMIELGVYANIPHLLIPVVTDPKQASTALKWAVREMDARFRQLASVGVRHIDQFNELMEDKPGLTRTDERTGVAVQLSHLPYLIIVIDEMADLMMTSSADVEESIMRLAQMARAVGIHLVLATQRPSVDVITGTIKANFPSRIAFRVSQRVDSRTIIDHSGAEQLLGRGDMLFLPPGSVRLIRLHGGFITESELNRITAFLKRQGRPVYDESVLEEPEEVRGGYDLAERDTMFLDAVRLVLQEGQCSITLLQRRLRLGYARAARIVDSMEQEGIVGPADGSKPREVMAGPEILETLEASGSLDYS